VYSLELVIIISLVSGVVGIIAGLIVAQRAAPSRKSQHQLETQLAEMKQQQQEYQQGVSEHFNETAQLLNQLSSSYRDVHNHLAKGAQRLASNAISDTLIPIPDPQSFSDKSQRDEETDDTTLSPPLDYAPKSAQQRGALDQEN